MANILSRILTQNQSHTADSLCETQALYVNLEEFYETRKEMWGANSDAVGSWLGRGGYSDRNDF
jgi:hypothetical protein